MSILALKKKKSFSPQVFLWGLCFWTSSSSGSTVILFKGEKCRRSTIQLSHCNDFGVTLYRGVRRTWKLNTTCLRGCAHSTQRCNSQSASNPKITPSTVMSFHTVDFRLDWQGIAEVVRAPNQPTSVLLVNKHWVTFFFFHIPDNTYNSTKTLIWWLMPVNIEILSQWN